MGAKRGRAGGYFLIREPSKISLGELLQQIDGPIAPPALPLATCLPPLRRL
ncbi:Rrf2 family transcriptional regulator [Alloyangia mangrovi]|uniref:Rrf2 family transcriptional regulator n=1 Tax=Alloyangia mangrovi TaxID=1779329 RepID=UPI0035D4E1CC